MSINRLLTAIIISVWLSFSMPLQAMGLRSFVALPVEQGGSVVRSTVLHHTDSDKTDLILNVAYGISHQQTLLLALPYQLSPHSGDSLGDAGILYRHIVRQVDTAAGTDRLGLLAGVVLATDSERDAGLQAGAVFTHFRDRHEWDIDVLYQQGLDQRANAARYDLSWQYRLTPEDYPDWGMPQAWYVVSELGGRWLQEYQTVHQLTLGLQWVARRWVIEAGIIKDINAEHQTHYLLSVRFH